MKVALHSKSCFSPCLQSAALTQFDVEGMFSPAAQVLTNRARFPRGAFFPATSPHEVTPDLVSTGLVGNAEHVPTASPPRAATSLASVREHAFAGPSCPQEPKSARQRLSNFLRTQAILISIGTLIWLTLWALRIPFAILPIMVNSVCIGNVLGFLMEHASPLYDHFRPPWNWIIYVPLLALISVVGILLSAVGLYLMSGAGTTYLSLIQTMAPFGMVVSMTVGTVWYAVIRIQMLLRERNVQLETALAAETSVVRNQEQELARARQIQQDLLPKSIPQLRGIQVAGAWQPASAVSGDYYDVLALDEHRLAVCIGDVVGKGITAALLMANLQAAFRAFATADASPASVCGKLNTFMCGNVACGKFISFFYCIVDARDRSLFYENAGHCPAQLIRRSGETLSLSGEGAVLGVLPDWNYRNNRLQLESGDHLILFTDGVTEAEDAYGTEFGEERVVRALQNAAGHSAEEVRRALMEAVTGYCSGNFRDDATVVVLAVQ
jgi:sigma-B regulation protein RsbU (phosphoserine phosphatase)